MSEATNHPAVDWNSLVGHRQLRDWFGSAIRRGRLGGSFLFVGPAGIGKTTVAQLLARTLLCETRDPAEMQPCGHCEACAQVSAGTHPDLIQVRKPSDKSFIPLDLLIGRPEVRMQEGFCRDIQLKAFRGRRKVAILHDADYLNEEGANCLLKTLEEPPSSAVIILVGSGEQRQLPTIRSRSQLIRFHSMNSDESIRLLRQVHGIDATDQQIEKAVEVAAGDMQVAARLLDGQADELRDSLVGALGSPNPDPVSLTRIITSHVDQAGKDASKRRDAMRDLFSMAVQHFRHQMRHEAVRAYAQPATLARLDRSVRALREVDRSANQSTLIECYAADIAAGTTGDRGEIG